MIKNADGVFFLTGKDFTNAGSASSNLKGILENLGISHEIIRRASIAAFEAEMNAIIYAVAGMMHYSVTPEAVKVILQDMGPGIPDIDLAMKEGYSTAPDYIREMGFGSGMGLPNIKRNADKLTLTSVVGEGTTLEFVIYLEGPSPQTSC
jgi:anti-sigma regulatory factor (Ser/Thr protein kinase)